MSGLIEKHEKRQRELGNESKTINPPIGLVLQMRIINRFKNPKYREACFAWMTDFRIPVTNNCSERAFRMEKTRMKVSGQFGSTENAQNHADAMTYLATCEKNGINCCKAIEAVFAGKPYTLEELGSMSIWSIPNYAMRQAWRGMPPGLRQRFPLHLRNLRQRNQLLRSLRPRKQQLQSLNPRKQQLQSLQPRKRLLRSLRPESNDSEI